MDKMSAWLVVGLILWGVSAPVQSASCVPAERGVLLKLKSGLREFSAAWNTTDCCKWEGITCSKAGHVIGLDMQSISTNYLDASVPISTLALVSGLTELESLDASSKGFKGAIPSSFSKLTKLKSLSISDNSGISGTIPAFFGSIHGLEQFLASNTGLKGPIPAAFFGLSNLRELDLSRSIFDVVDSGGFGGVLPSKISKLRALQILKLGSAKISGRIPAGFGKLTNLQELSLDSNQLSGPIPAALGSLKRLHTLNLAGNSLSGAIPSQLGHLTNLQVLDLSSNSFTGKIPVSFGYLSSLQTLKLQDNSLAGPLPRSLGKLAKLNNLYLYNNPISGTIPTSFKGLKSLAFLWVSGTKLSGPLPDIFGQMKNLTNVHIYDNPFLTGSLPPSVGVLSLEVFDAHNSSISGAINKFPDSTQVDLRENKISSIPAELGERLSILRLSGNKLTFEGVKGIATMAGPRTIELSGCGLKGSIPSWFSKIKIAWPSTGFEWNGDAKIDLSFNSISGSIPDFGHMETLETLDLHHNSFSGSIPSSLANITLLKYLDLSSNQLSGPIPSSFLDLSVSFLDLSHNKLTGKIPQGGALNRFNASSFASNAGLCGSPLPAC